MHTMQGGGQKQQNNANISCLNNRCVAGTKNQFFDVCLHSQRQPVKNPIYSGINPRHANTSTSVNLRAVRLNGIRLSPCPTLSVLMCLFVCFA